MELYRPQKFFALKTWSSPLFKPFSPQVMPQSNCMQGFVSNFSLLFPSPPLSFPLIFDPNSQGLRESHTFSRSIIKLGGEKCQFSERTINIFEFRFFLWWLHALILHRLLTKNCKTTSFARSWFDFCSRFLLIFDEQAIFIRPFCGRATRIC